ncbi:conjugative transposon protein TraJ [Hymenobacter latericus]|uniref:conjugative transposon protein TraJ n=1 Tax=Hymenobacter sp. YIM 151858-1 TaxID=2987688 RepID=UPI002227E1EC|nr:conjugative transposon protein TraJ [Hymenobacter sp. YIM 151858-1]UYZ61154.1 conjugative transposon protein TraJ [Hymenobacter sp. YIM 151858-1]
MLLQILLQVTSSFKSLQDLLDTLYREMYPLCKDFINVGRALGGLGALALISVSVWRSLANAEPIDFFPLLRPFAIGLAIALFPLLLDTLNGVMNPLSGATKGLVQAQNQTIVDLQNRKEKVLASKAENQPFESDEAFEQELAKKEYFDLSGRSGLYFDRMAYNVQKSFREWLKEALELAYNAAALVINTIRTFFLIVLSIIGPISFGFAIWPGFEGTLSGWFSRYVNVFLWLPVANIYGAIIARIQVLMLQQDLDNLAAGADASTADYGYMIFLLIAIVGYFTVPTVAGWIIQATGLQTAISRLQAGGGVANTAAAGAGAVAGRLAGGTQALGSTLLPNLHRQPASGYKPTANP